VHAFLYVLHGEVVDHGADLLQKEAQQRTGLDVADALFHVLIEIALDGLDSFLTDVAVKFNGHARARWGG